MHAHGIPYGETGDSATRASTCMLVLCGVPGAGKSSLASALVQHVHGAEALQQSVEVYHVCFDDHLDAAVRAAEHADGEPFTTQPAFEPEVWQESRTRALTQVHQLLQSPGSSIATTQDAGRSQVTLRLVVVDDNQQYRSMRYHCCQLARRAKAAYLQLYLQCDVDASFSHNASRLGFARVPDEALRRMHAVLEPPEPERHAFERPTLVLHTSHPELFSCATRTDGHGSSSSGTSCDRATSHSWLCPGVAVCSGCMLGHVQSRSTQEAAVKDEARAEAETKPDGLSQKAQAEPDWGSLAAKVWSWVDAHWGPPAPEPPSEAEVAERRAAGTAANSASLLHGLDLRTRHCVSAAVASAPAAARVSVAARLNSARQQLLAAARSKAHGPFPTSASGMEGELAALESQFEVLCVGAGHE